MRNFRHLHLFFCFYDRVTSILRVLHSRVANIHTGCPVETMAGPSKAYQRSFYKILPVQYAFGGPGGSRTRVQNTFQKISLLPFI